MSIYTPVQQVELEAFISEYSLGSLVSFEGIEAGVENTNYFVTTSNGQFVLTLVESVSAEQAQRIVAFQSKLAKADLKVAAPVHDNKGNLVGLLNGRPAVIAERLTGKPVEEPTIEQSAAIGLELAKFHTVSAEKSNAETANVIEWCSALFEELKESMGDEDKALIKEFLLRFTNMPWNIFASGSVHADLFPDNALFDGEELKGVIDFYHTINTPFLYDLAVALNAWCYSEEVGCFYPVKEMAMMKSYASIRTLSDDEKNWLKAMRKLAALRFWLSRLKAQIVEREGFVVSTRDPRGKRQLLIHLDAV